ncbi:DMT family transporter [Alcanivorax sp. 1008]|uniref:DMT family transporter n=1 Tax=Alcanivorax sp. 1008 TaxID=2816853 RepID=UPI001DB0CC45|nr:DMT family transporter [Alcanivorax sp. 1008]MCC1495323.1 DMT family transporter [Alcanivorax sp. 1008]
MSSSFTYALIMLFAGLGIPIMAALNGSLGGKLQSPVLAATILFAVGLAISLCVLLLTEGLPQDIPLKSTPWYLFCGGIFVIFYVLAITWVAPRFGVANAVSFVLLGQLVAMTVIDHYGFIGVPQYSITGQRILGLLFMAVGVLMVVNRAPST